MLNEDELKLSYSVICVKNTQIIAFIRNKETFFSYNTFYLFYEMPKNEVLNTNETNF